MIRDIEEDDVYFYVDDEIDKRMLIQSYHPIFQLEVSQFEDEDFTEENIEEQKNEIDIISDKILCRGTEQTITIKAKDFGGTKYRSQKGENGQYIPLNQIKQGYYNTEDHKFYSDYKYEQEITEIEINDILIDNDTKKQYILINDTLKEIHDIIPGIISEDQFTPFFTNYDDYPDITAAVIINTEIVGYYHDENYDDEEIGGRDGIGQFYEDKDLTEPIVNPIDQAVYYDLNTEYYYQYDGSDYVRITSYLPKFTEISGYYTNDTFYENEDHNNEITPIETTIYYDLNNNKYYKYENSYFICIDNYGTDFPFTKVAGYYSAEDNLFYEDSDQTIPIDPVITTIYHDISSDKDKYYAYKNNTFIVLNFYKNDIHTNAVGEYTTDDIEYSQTDVFITYDNNIRLEIRDMNYKLLHTAEFPHLIGDTVEYKCIFTQAGLYILKVTITNNDEVTEQSFDIRVVEEDDYNEIMDISVDDEEEPESTEYYKNKIGNRVINPQINQPVNLKCSLKSLILTKSVDGLLNSNRSNILFTSPTDKEYYQIYQFESHNIYDDNKNIEDTWFFIRADFIDEYIEMHILPTYINSMDNIILSSDNDIVNYLLNKQEDESESENTSPETNFYTFTETNDEYRIDEMDGDLLVIPNTKTGVCKNPQMFDLTEEISDYSSYRVTFSLYSSYNYCSTFYINNLKVYGENKNLYIGYNDNVDILPYDLLGRGEHTIEFSIEDKNSSNQRAALSIDEYIVSTDLLQEVDFTYLEVGFQQSELANPITEVLSESDIDRYSYTYFYNLSWEEILNDEPITDVTTKKITRELLDTESDTGSNIYTYKYPLDTQMRYLHKIEIDIIKKGINSNIIGLIDRTNLDQFVIDNEKISQGYTKNGTTVSEKEILSDSYIQTTLLDYTQHINDNDKHRPIQYNNSNIDGVFCDDNSKKIITTSLNIEDINVKPLPGSPEYEYLNNNTSYNIIHTLKYFNDDLYSEAYRQINPNQPSLTDALQVFENNLYYNQEWLDKEDTDNEYYEVNYD